LLKKRAGFRLVSVSPVDELTKIIFCQQTTKPCMFFEAMLAPVFYSQNII